MYFFYGVANTSRGHIRRAPGPHSGREVIIFAIASRYSIKRGASASYLSVLLLSHQNTFLMLIIAVIAWWRAINRAGRLEILIEQKWRGNKWNVLSLLCPFAGCRSSLPHPSSRRQSTVLADCHPCSTSTVILNFFTSVNLHRPNITFTVYNEPLTETDQPQVKLPWIWFIRPPPPPTPQPAESGSTVSWRSQSAAAP